MQIELPDIGTRARIDVQGDRPMDDDEYYEFCMKNPDLRIEREANGEIIIMPRTGGETGYRNSELNFQLTAWSKRDGRGRAFDSNTEFFLPDGAALSPDASWVLKDRLAMLTKEQKRRFLPLCPDFVVELTSPSDRLNKVKSKMREWIDNGAALGWLIDADRRTVYVYRPGTEPEKLVDVDHIDGEGPVDGFRLDLSDIWQSL
jgi:Uma2 family endonuclease